MTEMSSSADANVSRAAENCGSDGMQVLTANAVDKLYRLERASTELANERTFLAWCRLNNLAPRLAEQQVMCV